MDMEAPDSFLSLRLFGSVPEFDHQLEQNERAKFARTRRDIELQQQELLQKALLEEHQLSL